MLIAENINNIDYNNIIITHPIKNNFQTNNNFYKILYSNDFTTLNGIYCYFKLENITIDKNLQTISFCKIENKDVINKLIIIESKLLNQYVINKDKSFKIFETLNNSFIKYGVIENLDNNNFYHDKYKYTDNDNDNDNDTLNYFHAAKKKDIELIIKISGIWESNNTNGLTFKFLSIS